MPDQAENDFAIMRCRARVVPLRTVNESLSDASASRPHPQAGERVRMGPKWHNQINLLSMYFL